jgi:SPP1 gp7 family putative phage head morphogenesis protein
MTTARAAHTIEAERVRLENYAVDAVARAGDTALRHAAAAVRLGHDPVDAARDVLIGNPSIRQPGLEDLITRALVAAHLLGLRRTALAARQHYGREVLTLSRAGDKLSDWLGKLVDVAAVAEDEVQGLFARARAAAARIVQRITAPLLARVGNAPVIVAQKSETPFAAPTPRAVAVELGTQFAKAGFVTGAEHGIATVLGGSMVRAYESGRDRGWRTPQVQEKLWGLRYSAILDNVTTPICRGLNDTVLPLNDPLWQTYKPPLHYNCRSCVIEVFSSTNLRRPPAEVRNYEVFGPDFFMG